MMNLHDIPLEGPLRPIIPEHWIGGIASWQHNHWEHRNNLVLIARNNMAIAVEYYRSTGTRVTLPDSTIEEWARVYPGHQIAWDRLTIERVL